MTTETRSNSKLAILPMWVIDRIKEEMRLGPAAWQAITEAVEKAEVPQALPCEVKLPPGTVIGQGTAVSTLMLAIQQRASYPAQAQVFSSVEPEQPHPEPIAWMVGTAFWWTKEEAERDAAATGLPIVGLGPMTDTAEVDRLRAERRRMDDALVACSNERDSLGAELAQCEAMAAMVAEREWAEHVGTGPVSGKVEAAFTQLHNDLHEADDKLAERDALLDRVVDHAKFWHDHPYAEVVEGIAKDYKALSASAVPSAPTPQTINGHKLNCKAVDDYKPGDCSCGAEPDSKS
jgi:hypothetical protein